ncbi:MAG: hypothetical protein ACK4ZJ_17300, partial [Allorhizobium sp.]
LAPLQVLQHRLVPSRLLQVTANALLAHWRGSPELARAVAQPAARGPRHATLPAASAASDDVVAAPVTVYELFAAAAATTAGAHAPSRARACGAHSALLPQTPARAPFCAA